MAAAKKSTSKLSNPPMTLQAEGKGNENPLSPMERQTRENYDKVQTEYKKRFDDSCAHFLKREAELN